MHLYKSNGLTHTKKKYQRSTYRGKKLNENRKRTESKLKMYDDLTK